MGGSKDNRARAAPRHFSDPQLPRPVVVERREYYDGVGRPSHSFRAESPQPARRQSRRQRATRSPPIREREFGGYDAEEEEDMYNMGYARPSRGRMRGGGRSSRSCSRNRVSVDEGSMTDDLAGHELICRQEVQVSQTLAVTASPTLLLLEHAEEDLLL